MPKILKDNNLINLILTDLGSLKNRYESNLVEFFHLFWRKEYISFFVNRKLNYNFIILGFEWWKTQQWTQ